MKKIRLAAALAAIMATLVFSQDEVTSMSSLAATQGLKPRTAISTGFGDSVLGQISDGAGWQTTITLVNLRATSTPFTIACYGDSGGPQQFPWVGIGTTSTVNGNLVGSGSMVLTTAGTAPANSQGWCYVTTPLSGSYDVGAFAIYAYAPTGQQVSVPASRWFLTNTNNSLILAYDNTNGYNYGVALVDSNTFTYAGIPKDTINVSITDQSGRQIGTDSFQITPSGHVTFVLADRYPATANTRGTITFTINTSSGIGTLAGLGLRATPWLAFTSVEMIEPATY